MAVWRLGREFRGHYGCHIRIVRGPGLDCVGFDDGRWFGFVGKLPKELSV
jgi:hypothetical protein